MASTKVDLTNGEQVQGTLPLANGGTGGTSQSTARTALALVPGTDVQAFSSALATWATKTPPSGTPVGTSDSQSLTNKDLSGSGNVFPTSLALASQVAPSVYTTTIGNGSTTAFTINHNLGTRNVTVTIYDTSTFEVIRVPPILTDTNNLSLTFATAPTTGQFAVVVMGGALVSQPGVFTQTIGNGSLTTFTITHNLGTRAVTVTGYDTSTFNRVNFDVAFTTINTVTLAFQTAPSTNGVAVTVQGGNLASTGVAMANISDATTIGRQLLGATNAAAALALLTPLQTAASAFVATTESTSSTTYVDLTTVTDTVTVTVGASGAALVSIYSQSAFVSGSGWPLLGFALSGANTQAATDSFAASFQVSGVTQPMWVSATFVLTGLTPGSTTFKLKYKNSASATNSFSNRRIGVIPL